MTTIAGPTPVRPAAIEAVTVKWDNKHDLVGDRTVKVYSADQPHGTRVIVDQSGDVLITEHMSGFAGKQLQNGFTQIVNAHSAALAKLGTNAPTNDLATRMHAVNAERGSWYIGIDRAGTKSDQVIRGSYRDQLPVAVRDVLSAAGSIAGAVLRSQNAGLPAGQAHGGVLAQPA